MEMKTMTRNEGRMALRGFVDGWSDSLRVRLPLLSTTVVALLWTTAVPTLAQQADSSLWVADGSVSAVALSGDTLYIGGSFTRVGPQSGSFVPIETSSGSVVNCWPKVNGSVRAIAPDGAGGWYVGGLFTRVGGLPRNNLAHIRADLTVGPWNPGSDGYVLALAVQGTNVFAGGWFTLAGGASRGYLAALDASTGLATGWDPSPNSAVYSLAVSGGVVYAGGAFTDVGGTSRNKVVAIDAASGLPTSWDPQVDSFDGVYALAVDGGTVFLGGGFSQAGGQTRINIAAVDATTGLATGFAPDANGMVSALVVSGTTVYAGGQFSGIGLESRNRIAALDSTTGVATSWNPDAISSFGGVSALAVSGTTVYAGGMFTGIGGQPRSNIAAIDAGTALATSWDPHAFGAVYAIGLDGGTVIAGGDLSSVGGLERHNIAALDVGTGTATSWNPDANGAVTALAVSGSTVYAGGQFTSVGGQARAGIAALDAADGLPTAWNPDASGGFPTSIHALAVEGSTVYAGGSFTSIGGQPRTGLAALDVTTGLATSWDPAAGPFSAIRVLAVSSMTLYVGGDFSSIGGATRSGLAQLDRVTGLATTWNPQPSVGSVQSMALGGSSVYVGGFGAEAFDLATGAVTAWSPGTFGSVYALALDGDTVYAGGFFFFIGGEARNYIAALDATTGLATTWDPSANDLVASLAVGPDAVYAGGYFLAMGETPARSIAAIRLPCLTPLVSYRDADGDGYGDPGVTTSTCDSSIPAGHVSDDTDCNDCSPEVNPGAADEICDGVDDDCSGADDDGFIPQPTTCGVGACASAGNTACVAGAEEDSCSPGAPSSEVCDGLDNDCDAQVDEDVPGGCPCAMPGTSLVSFWPGDGNADDIHGGHDGTALNGVSYVAGRVGQAFSFDGSDDLVGSIGAPSTYSFIQNTGVFSIVAWIRLDNPAALLQQAITGNTQTTAEKGHFFIWENSDGLQQLRVGLVAGTPGVPVIEASSGTNMITDNAWHHVAAVGDGTDVTFYVDGVGTLGTGTIGTLSTGDSTRLMTLGTCGGACVYDGQLDEVQIYDQSLNSAEILAIYMAGGNGACQCTDADGDGYGAEGGLSCPSGTVQDCDDADAIVNPGMAVPVGSPGLTAAHSGFDALLSWSAVADASGYDVVGGSLAVLHGTQGNFAVATDQCLANNVASTSVTDPAAGASRFFLVRPVNCGGGGTYGGSLRDAGIAAASGACP